MFLFYVPILILAVPVILLIINLTYCVWEYFHVNHNQTVRPIHRVNSNMRRHIRNNAHSC